MVIPVKRSQAIARLRAAGRIVAQTWVTLRELDRRAEQYLTGQAAEPLYRGYRGNPPQHPPFPGVICTSVNHEICHGLPDERVLHEGDIVGIDIGLKYQGYCGDACVTYGVGQISCQAQRLLDITRACLRVGIQAAQPGGHLNDIGAAIESYAATQHVSVVREWGGHGLGTTLHEPPAVLHVRQPERGPRLRPGMVFTIEPMVNAASHEWRMLDDGWTVVTADGSLSAQFEHTIVVTERGPEILTRL
jgi:methionyl aminopeptidase